MALKTNSKKAKENIRAYVTNNFLAYDYTSYDTFEETARHIFKMFRDEYLDGTKPGWFKSIQDAFTQWTQGLSGGGVFDFWTYKSDCNPVDILGKILEETENEKARFNEDQAAATLTYLIYKEIYNTASDILKGVKI